MIDVGIKLYAKSGTPGTYAPLVSVTAAPAMGATPGRVENTPLDSPVKTYDMDRPDLPQLDFTYNYSKENLAAVKAAISATVAHDFLLEYPDHAGVEFTATGSTWQNAASRGNELECTLSFVPSAMDDVDDVSTLLGS